MRDPDSKSPGTPPELWISCRLARVRSMLEPARAGAARTQKAPTETLMSKQLWLGLLFLLTLPGCYSYHAIPVTSTTTGQTVRVTLSPEEAVRQQETVGALRQRVEGEVVEKGTDGSLGLTVPRPASSPSQRASLNTFVTLPPSSIVQVEEKRFSVGRTALLAGAGAAAAVAVLAVVEAVAGDGGDEGPPNNARVRIPIGRIFFR